MDGFSGQFAVLHCLYGEVLAERRAVTAGIHAG